jgi:antibiotic biosynthesis monooxygenase (ABM) superfamily enzyme
MSHEIVSVPHRRREHAAVREPATAVFARRVRPGREADYEALAREMVEDSKKFAGHVAAAMLHDEGSSTYSLLYSFLDRRSLQAWLDSPARRRLQGQAERLSEEHLRVAPLTGLETWFTLPSRATIKPPPRWKMWLVSLLAIYPLVVAFQATVVPTIRTWPLLVRSAILPLTLLTLMTFVVMPVVTRVVQPWLSRGT